MKKTRLMYTFLYNENENNFDVTKALSKYTYRIKIGEKVRVSPQATIHEN